MDFADAISGDMTITPGRYRHFKGNEYQVLGTARHTETGETLVVYRALSGAGDLWVRPLEHFIATIVYEGVEQVRFRLISNK